MNNIAAKKNHVRLEVTQLFKSKGKDLGGWDDDFSSGDLRSSGFSGSGEWAGGQGNRDQPSGGKEFFGKPGPLGRQEAASRGKGPLRQDLNSLVGPGPETEFSILQKMFGVFLLGEISRN